MTEREEVLEALNHCEICDDDPNCPNCPFLRIGDCRALLKEKLKKLLKAQEQTVLKVDIELSQEEINKVAERALQQLVPRVLTLEEAKTHDGALLVEHIGTFGQPIMDWLLLMEEHRSYPFIRFANARRSEVLFERTEYGKSWRCWTARPTEEQREAVKWND